MTPGTGSRAGMGKLRSYMARYPFQSSSLNIGTNYIEIMVKSVFLPQCLTFPLDGALQPYLTFAGLVDVHVTVATEPFCNRVDQ